VRLVIGVRSARPDPGGPPEPGRYESARHEPARYEPGRYEPEPHEPGRYESAQHEVERREPGPHEFERYETEPRDPGHDLLDLLRRAAGPAEITSLRADGPDTRADIAAYLDALLSHPGSPYVIDPTARQQVAGLVAARVAPSFLDARIAGRRLRDSPDRQVLDDPAWLRSLDEGTVGQLAADLVDVATPEHPREEILAVLRATAFAQGAGMPWAEIWPAVTAAILDRDLPAADDTIGYVLSSRLSGYLARDTEDGRHVWRPAHERLAEVLRPQPDRILRDRP
jgi:hypothetical protein